jgi:hypothetical protein
MHGDRAGEEGGRHNQQNYQRAFAHAPERR